MIRFILETCIAVLGVIFTLTNVEHCNICLNTYYSGENKLIFNEMMMRSTLY
jgi:hypothetical protein